MKVNCARNRSGTGWRPGLLLAVILLSMLAAGAARAAAPEVHALMGVRVVTNPGEVIESGTVVFRDGILTAVGADVPVPPDARLWDFTEDVREDGSPAVTVYPGLIDLYRERSWPLAGDDEDAGPQPADLHPNQLVRPERRMSRWGLEASTAEKLRQAGFTAAVVAPEEGLFRGVSALVNLGNGELADNLVLPRVAHNVTLESNSFREGFPTSLMGSIALARQVLSDAAWYTEALDAYRRNPAQGRPPYQPALEKLIPMAAGDEPVVFEAEELDNVFRFAALAAEHGFATWLVGTGEEYRRAEAVAALGWPLLLPVDFPEAPDLGEEDDLTVDLLALRHWDRAPGNAKALLDAGATVALVSHGLSSPADLHGNLARAIEGGLTSAQALAALTTTPARLLGLDRQAGSLEVGKMANLVVVQGELFTADGKIRSVWVDGQRYELEEIAPPEVDPLGTWDLDITAGGGARITAVLEITGDPGQLSGTITGQGVAIPLTDASVSAKNLTVTFDGTSLGMPGTFTLTLSLDGDQARGSGTGPMGSFSLEGTRTSQPEVRQ